MTYLPVLLVEDMDLDASICPVVSQFPQSRPVHITSIEIVSISLTVPSGEGEYPQLSWISDVLVLFE